MVSRFSSPAVTGRDNLPDLDNCAKEPIHIPGAIQPHGAMLVLREETLEIVGQSQNASAFLGLGERNLRGVVLDTLMDTATLRAALQSNSQNIPAPISMHSEDATFDGVPFRSNGALVLELEKTDRAFDAAAFYRDVQWAMSSAEAAPSLEVLYQECARAIARLTGFDRVMVYKFDAEWNGSVVAEDVSTDWGSYLGHHFPASDIPAQARELYRKNWLRIIPDSNYEAVPVEPGGNPVSGGSLDLSKSVLRSVSPIHLEYLRNMGVRASMSISLVIKGELWGLIACHHRARRPLPYAVRAACELYGQIVSAQIAFREEQARMATLLEVRRVQSEFFDHFSHEVNFVDALVKYTPSLLQLVQATGAALCLGKKIVLLGECPPEPAVQALRDWVRRQPLEDSLAIDHLSAVHPEAAEYEKIASGILAFSISRVKSGLVIWFRPEAVTTILWAGDPTKAMIEMGGRINPRKSFAAWRQTVGGHSQPWRESDRQTASELRAAINALILKRTDDLLHLNAELEEKNTELNSFAYLASHDLQEPLRGLRNYSRFLLEDYSHMLDPEGREKLETLSHLARQMAELIEALAHFTKAGRMEIRPQETDLHQIIEEVKRARAITLQGVEVRVPRPLPKASADSVLVREVFDNLVSNAVKYNVNAEKWIEIGYVEGEGGAPTQYYVKDNGIGIRPKHQKDVFVLFRRLHPRERYGGGTGVGLALVKSIVERHGGSVWFESEPGAGTTFFFTLGNAIS